MKTKKKTHLPYNCIYCSPLPKGRRPKVGRLGVFLRACDRRRIKRYYCYDCRRSFSDATRTFEYRQQKRSINGKLFRLLVSKVSMRRAALNMGINRGTVDRRLVYFSKVGDSKRLSYLESTRDIGRVQFDDMESSEHTKLKPLSIPMIVEEPTRRILSFDVVSMPAKGHLAEISRKKYGRRPDKRKLGWHSVFKEVTPSLLKSVAITSDMHTMYPHVIKAHLPHATHIRKKGRRACVAGQGELKRGGFDPLFSFNQTAAMLRDNISRLIRRTWCNTKKAERLKMHISIYTYWHNEWITARLEGRKPSFAF